MAPPAPALNLSGFSTVVLLPKDRMTAPSSLVDTVPSPSWKADNVDQIFFFLDKLIFSKLFFNQLSLYWADQRPLFKVSNYQSSRGSATKFISNFGLGLCSTPLNLFLLYVYSSPLKSKKRPAKENFITAKLCAVLASMRSQTSVCFSQVGVSQFWIFFLGLC